MAPAKTIFFLIPFLVLVCGAFAGARLSGMFPSLESVSQKMMVADVARSGVLANQDRVAGDGPVAQALFLNPKKKSEIEENVRQTNLAIADNKMIAEQNIETGIDEIAAVFGGLGEVKENIRQIADIVTGIEQLNGRLAKQAARRREIDNNIRQLENDIANLPANVLLAIKNEKMKELEGFKMQVKSIDSEIAQSRQEAEQKTKEKEDLENLVLGMGGEGEDIKRKLDDFEAGIVRLETERIRLNEALLNDTDADGLPDGREVALGTDPANPDTDADGALDGDEVAKSHNPLVPDDFARIDFSDPRLVPPARTDIYKVEKVESVKLTAGGLGISFEGQALPNALAALYIYSVPIVVPVKADDSGHWAYVLNDELNDGQHAVYVARADSAGRIVARSEIFVFAKNGAGIARVIADETAPLPPSVQKLKSDYMFWLVFSTALALAIALFLIGLAVHRARASAD